MSDLTRPLIEEKHTPSGGGGSTVPDPPARTPPLPVVPGYELGAEIGQGGMGVVYRARDRGIGRDVAVKVLQERYAPTSAVAARFVEEARITGQLQHPGIPAVHQVGFLPDGRPYLAMKLIKGDTLDDLLNAGSVNTLAVFEAICQAVGYAHAHGVLHRDLKPANVMVGSFGEVQVMDWGLAKVLLPSPPGGRGVGGEGVQDSAAPTEIRSGRDSETQHGAVMGTRGYMSPEQATGQTELIDRRSDVFGLGAILCKMLTGKPPFAQLDGCGAEPGLVELCKACLSIEPDGRPADANAVASAVAALRTEAEERAKQAELDRAKAEVQAAEQRKRRRVVQWAGGVTAAVLLAGVIGTTVGLVRAEERRVEADQARGRESERADGERRAKDEAVEQQRRADRAEAEALASYQASTDDAIELLIGSKPVIGAQEKAYLDGAVKRWTAFAARQGDDERSRTIRGTAHFTLANLWYKLSRYAEAEAEWESALDLQQKLVADFPDSAEHQLNLARTQIRSAGVSTVVGKPEPGRARLDAARTALEALVHRDPGASEYRFQLACVYHNTGFSHLNAGDHGDADKNFRLARDLFRTLVEQHPTTPEYRNQLANTHTGLGASFINRGRSGDADAEYRAAIRLYEGLLTEAPETPSYRINLAYSRNGRASALGLMGKRQESLAEYRAALEIVSRLAEQFPAVDEYPRWIANARSNIGNALRSMGETAQAAEEYRAALQVHKRLAERFADVPMYASDLGLSYMNLAGFSLQIGDLDCGVDYAGQAINILTPLHRDQPRNVKILSTLQNSHRGRALLYNRLCRYPEAVADWDRLLDLLPPEDLSRWGVRVFRARPLMQAGRTDEALRETAELAAWPTWPVNQWYDFACVYAIASAKVADKKQEYADLAMEMLQKAVKAGYKDHAQMKKDTDLDPLRGREDFKKLLAELEAKFPREMLPAPRRE